MPAPFLPPLPEPSATGSRPSPAPREQTLTPLIIYGAATAIGLFALRLALKSGSNHPIVCVAGSSGARIVAPLLDASKGDVVIDYREGDDATVNAIRKAVGDATVAHVYDCVSNDQSEGVLARVLAPRSDGGEGVGAKEVTLAVIDPRRPFNLVPSNVYLVRVYVGVVHIGDSLELGYVFCRYFTRGLEQGWFRGHPHRLTENGLEGIEKALADLKGNRVHGEKYICRIADTPGVGGARI